MKKLKLNIKNSVRNILINHPELCEDIKEIKNSKSAKRLAYNIFGNILGWAFFAGITTLMFLLFAGFIFNEKAYVTILVIGISLIVAPCIIAMEYIRNEEIKKNKNRQ